MSLIVKLLIVGLIGYFVVWPWLRRRWPAFTRRLNLALILSLIAVVLFRVLVTLSRSYFEKRGGAPSDGPRGAP